MVKHGGWARVAATAMLALAAVTTGVAAQESPERVELRGRDEVTRHLARYEYGVMTWYQYSSTLRWAVAGKVVADGKATKVIEELAGRRDALGKNPVDAEVLSLAMTLVGQEGWELATCTTYAIPDGILSGRDTKVNCLLRRQVPRGLEIVEVVDARDP